MERHTQKELFALLQQVERFSSHLPESYTGLKVEPLAGDGSSRSFSRVLHNDYSLCVAVLPGKTGDNVLKEQEAAWEIGKHLYNHKVPVPKQYGFDRNNGLLLYEDLGGLHLQQRVISQDSTSAGYTREMVLLYQQVLDVLFAMQLDGAQGFTTDWCHDTPHYDKRLMLEREANYFLTSFWKNDLKQHEADGLKQEFEAIADKAVSAPGGYFLHRDFQSRNIMIADEQIRIIDYQGGRFGPLGYDLASLLIDPYVALPGSVQLELLNYYYSLASAHPDVDQLAFKESYPFLAVQRNMQILGAFSFLSLVCHKPYFREYLKPALHSLQKLLPQCSLNLPVLKSVVHRAVDLLGS